MVKLGSCVAIVLGLSLIGTVSGQEYEPIETTGGDGEAGLDEGQNLLPQTDRPIQEQPVQEQSIQQQSVQEQSIQQQHVQPEQPIQQQSEEGQPIQQQPEQPIQNQFLAGDYVEKQPQPEVLAVEQPAEQQPVNIGFPSNLAEQQQLPWGDTGAGELQSDGAIIVETPGNNSTELAQENMGNDVTEEITDEVGVELEGEDTVLDDQGSDFLRDLMGETLERQHELADAMYEEAGLTTSSEISLTTSSEISLTTSSEISLTTSSKSGLTTSSESELTTSSEIRSTTTSPLSLTSSESLSLEKELEYWFEEVTTSPFSTSFISLLDKLTTNFFSLTSSPITTPTILTTTGTTPPPSTTSRPENSHSFQVIKIKDLPMGYTIGVMEDAIETKLIEEIEKTENENVVEEDWEDAIATTQIIAFILIAMVSVVILYVLYVARKKSKKWKEEKEYRNLLQEDPDSGDEEKGMQTKRGKR